MPLRAKIWPGCGFPRRLQSVLSLVRLRPHILLVPFLIMVVSMSLGLMAVELGSRAGLSTARDRDISALNSAAARITIAKNVLPLPAQLLHEILEFALKHGMNYSTIMSEWDAIAASCWDKASAGTSLISMTAAGKYAAVYPHTPDNDAFVGLDTLDFAGPYGAFGLIPLISRNYTSTGPFAFTWASGKQGYLTTYDIPIYIHAASENATFGIPWQPTYCPDNLCWNATTNVKWWGTATVVIDIAEYAGFLNPIAFLQLTGYQAQVRRQGEPFMNEPAEVTVFPLPEATQPSTGVIKVSVGSWGQLAWTLYAWKKPSSLPYVAPVQASVVLITLLLGIMLFAMLLSWEENRTILATCLPKEAINRMRLETDWKAATDINAEDNSLQLDTPAQEMLRVCDQVLLGNTPAMQTVLSVRGALLKSVDVYSVQAEDLVSRLHFSRYSNEVRKALVQQLLGAESKAEEPLQEDFNVAAGQEDGLTLMEVVLNTDEPGFAKLSTGHMAISPRKAISYGASQLVSQPTPSTTSSCQLEEDYLRLALFQILKIEHLQDQQKTGMLPVSIRLPPTLGRASLSVVFEDVGMDSVHERHFQTENPGPGIVLLDKVEQAVVSAFCNWSFNAFDLEEVTGGRPLSALAYSLLHSTGLITWASIDKGRLVSFLHRVEDGYASSAYHSARHAADVLQHFHMLVRWGGVMHDPVDHIALLACYLAAVVHDFEHRGRSNDFLINTIDDLAITYSDRSPMENHHLAAAWRLLKDPKYNFLSALPQPSWTRLRKLVIELVLSTDMKQHFAILGQFASLAQEGPAAGCLGGSTQAVSVALRTESSVHNNNHNNSGQLPALSETACSSVSHMPQIPLLLCLQMALKCSDLGHLAAPLNVHLLWVTALETEFFLQGDAERSLGLPISPLCDRLKEGVTKSQIGFFEFVCLPLFTAFTRYFKETKPLMKAVQSNHRHWIADSASRQVAKLEVARQVAKLEVAGKENVDVTQPERPSARDRS